MPRFVNLSRSRGSSAEPTRWRRTWPRPSPRQRRRLSSHGVPLASPRPSSLCSWPRNYPAARPRRGRPCSRLLPRLRRPPPPSSALASAAPASELAARWSRLLGKSPLSTRSQLALMPPAPTPHPGLISPPGARLASLAAPPHSGVQSRPPSCPGRRCPVRLRALAPKVRTCPCPICPSPARPVPARPLPTSSRARSTGCCPNCRGSPTRRSAAT
jgi:hypothetical protein